MNTREETRIDAVRNALHTADCASYLEDFVDGGKAYLKSVAENIDAFRSEYARRFGETPDPFELLHRNQKKGAAFIQWIAGESLPLDLYVMIWRILAGAEILSLDYRYVKDQTSVFRAELEPLRGTRNSNEKEIYECSMFWSFSLLSEFHMLAFMGKPYLVGSFLPIRQPVREST